MVCRQGGFIIQRHNELRDLEAEMLNMVCSDVQIGPVLQEINGEVLTPGTKRAADSGLDISRWWPFWSGKTLPFSTLGFVTRMQGLIKTSSQSKSTASIRVRGKE